MKNTVNKILLIIIIILLLVVCAFSGVLFAWFLGESNNSDSFIEYSGNIKLNIDVYGGIDLDRDGKLNEGALDENGNIIYPYATEDKNGNLVARSSRSVITSHLYNPIDRLMGATYEEYINGTSIILKLVVENPSSNTSKVKVSSCFSDLASYFYSLKDATPSEIRDVLSAHTARIMFKLEDLTVRVYGEDKDVRNNFTSGYNTLLRSSIADETSDSVQEITALNKDGRNSYFLWEVSSGERFADDLLLNPGELMEIDFLLSCMQTDEAYYEYKKYWDDYITAHPELDYDEKKYITDTYTKEITYILSEDEESGTELNISIEKIYIISEQVPSDQ